MPSFLIDRPGTAALLLAVSLLYTWCGRLHWRMMFILDPEGHRCELDLAWRRKDASLTLAFTAFVLFWPLLLAAGRVALWLEGKGSAPARADLPPG